MNYFTIYKYNDNLYQLKDKLGVLVTVVLGTKKALVFDTAYGIGNLYDEVRKITDLPLLIINSHGHMDHSCGNYQFEEVYIHKNDLELCKKHNSIEWRKKNIESAKRMNCLPNDFDEDNYLNQNEGNLKFLEIGDVFDLGNLTLEVINMEGHTKGSIGLYINQMKLLLVSDAYCPFVWLFLEESTSLSVYKNSLKKVLEIDFDNFLVGHGPRMFSKSKMYEFYDCALKLTLEKSVKVSFNNFDDVDSYCFTEGQMYNQDHCGIVFDPKKM